MADNEAQRVRNAITVQERARRDAYTAGDTKGAAQLTEKIEANRRKLK